MDATMFIPDRTDADYAEMEALLMAFVDDVRSATTAFEPLGQLRQLVRAHVRWRLEHPHLSELFDVAIGIRTRVKSLPDEHRARIRAIKRMYVDELRAVLHAGARQGTFHFDDVRVTAFAIVTLCGSAHQWYDPRGDLTAVQVADMYANLAAGMVRAPLCAHEL